LPCSRFQVPKRPFLFEYYKKAISDNGPQFVARDFKAYVRHLGMDHVRTSSYYPQSNGKIERVNQTLKTECIRRKVPLSLEEARRVAGEFVAYRNEERLQSAIGYVAPMDWREDQIVKEGEQKLERARRKWALHHRA